MTFTSALAAFWTKVEGELTSEQIVYLTGKVPAWLLSAIDKTYVQNWLNEKHTREKLQRVLDTDCEICEDPIVLSTRDGVWRLQCQDRCPPYAEGLTISRTVDDWDKRNEVIYATRQRSRIS